MRHIFEAFFVFLLSRAFAMFAKSNFSLHCLYACLYAHLSAWNNSDFAWRSVITFCDWIFAKIYPENSSLIKTRKKGALHELNLYNISLNSSWFEKGFRYNCREYETKALFISVVFPIMVPLTR
jgi:hypothetical protein